MTRTFLIFAGFTFWSCATGSPVGGRAPLGGLLPRPFSPASFPRTPQENTASRLVTLNEGERERTLQVAQSLVGQKAVVLAGKRYPDDCTGFVTAVFDQVGVDLLRHGKNGENGVTTIFRNVSNLGHIFKTDLPRPGDLVFFRETYDVNRDGRMNDGLTHVGLVESIESDHTIHVIHRTSKGVVRYHMNLKHDRKHRDSNGRTLNDYLRAATATSGPALTSQLFASYGSLWPSQLQVAER